MCIYKCMLNVYKNQQNRQTGSRNLMGPKTLPTIWGTYMKLVIKYQISAINSGREKCDEKYLGRTEVKHYTPLHLSIFVFCLMCIIFFPRCWIIYKILCPSSVKTFILPELVSTSPCWQIGGALSMGDCWVIIQKA
jgi:hypothetical protein